MTTDADDLRLEREIASVRSSMLPLLAATVGSTLFAPVSAASRGHPISNDRNELRVDLFSGPQGQIRAIILWLAFGASSRARPADRGETPAHQRCLNRASAAAMRSQSSSSEAVALDG